MNKLNQLVQFLITHRYRHDAGTYKLKCADINEVVDTDKVLRENPSVSARSEKPKDAIPTLSIGGYTFLVIQDSDLEGITVTDMNDNEITKL